MADRAGRRFDFALPRHFDKAAKTRPTCFHASATGPAARACSFPFALTPPSDTAILLSKSAHSPLKLRKQPTVLSANSLFQCLQNPHFGVCRSLI